MSEKTQRLYIAYGSNLNLQQMAFRCPTATVVGTSVLRNMRLLFRGESGNAVATVERYKGGTVPILVWELQPRDEAALDVYEGYPHFYRKETMRITLNGKRVSAMVYIMNAGHTLGLPGMFYLNAIREGYRSAGFDVEVLQQAVKASIVKEE